MLYSGVAFDVGQIVVLLTIITLLVKPLGGYMAKVYRGDRTFLSPVIHPVERAVYRLAGIDETAETGWRGYAWSMLIFSVLGIVSLYLILVLQRILPLNPQKMPGFSWHLALNTSVSFVTNTNWQAYSGESAASNFSQMLGFAAHNFLSAAAGMAVVIALIRGIARRSSETIGNFWADLTRGTLYILLPICITAALVLVSQGVIQNLKTDQMTNLVSQSFLPDGKQITGQVLPMGPVASQEAIKELGTNGGGFFNANSAHPFENPTPLTNYLEILLILLVPAALTNTFGRMVGSQREGWAVYAAMMLIFVAALAALYLAELHGNPLLGLSGPDVGAIHESPLPEFSGPNMEGKEVRFGTGASSLFAAATTGTSCGAVNTMHDSLTPLGGMIPMLLILLGEVVFGGVGSGLYTMIAFVVIAVFTAGLMIGRTPEYLGKKIEAPEMWTSVLTVLTAGALILVFVSIALVTKAGTSSILNPGAHGLSEVLYAFASMSNNNGSAFAGLNANTVFYNVLGSLAMLCGRFIPAVAVLYMAGSLAKKKYTPPSVGTLPTDSPAFVAWLCAVIIIVGALTFFPAISLGPFIEHLMMVGGA